MAFPNSDYVDVETLKSEGCSTVLPVRNSKYENLSVAASHKFFAEYNRLVLGADVSKGCCHPKGHAASLSLPESLPDRVEMACYLFEYGFASDDATEAINAGADVVPTDRAFADSYGLSAVSELHDRARTETRGKAQLEAKMILEIMAIDKEDAFSIMNTWQQWLEQGNGTRKANEFASFDEWVNYRYEDGAMPITHEIARFAIGIKVSDEEKQAALHVVRPILLATILQNDYNSFDKECIAYEKENGTSGIPNSIWILMKLRGINREEAAQMLVEIINESIQRYLTFRETYEKDNPGLREDVKRWMDAALFICSGAGYWGKFADRYHDHGPVNYSVVHRGLSKRSESEVDQTASKTSNKRSSTSLHADLEYVANGTKRYKTNNQQNPITRGEHGIIPDSLEDATFSFTDETVKEISDETVLAPYRYLSSLPSKGVREAAIKALNVWLDVPQSSLTAIRRITDYLHSSSLMLDDIQDESTLRRGKPATHLVFGVAQTINSANFLFALSLEDLQKLGPECKTIYNRQLRDLHIGQGMDLYWTRHVSCPTVIEYVSMVDHKTGGLFNLVVKLMQAEGTSKRDLSIDRMMTFLGRYFQIRDDYQNLVSADYTEAKGFCEDLDEGKFSLALIYTLQKLQGQRQRLLRDILQQRNSNGSGLSFETKNIVLDLMKDVGSLDCVKNVLKELEEAIDAEIEKIEEAAGEMNYVLRLLFERLRVNELKEGTMRRYIRDG